MHTRVFCLFLFTHIFSPLECPLSEVHYKREQQQQHRYQFSVFFIRSRGSL